MNLPSTPGNVSSRMLVTLQLHCTYHTHSFGNTLQHIVQHRLGAYHFLPPTDLVLLALLFTVLAGPTPSRLPLEPPPDNILTNFLPRLSVPPLLPLALSALADSEPAFVAPVRLPAVPVAVVLLALKTGLDLCDAAAVAEPTLGLTIGLLAALLLVVGVTLLETAPLDAPATPGIREGKAEADLLLVLLPPELAAAADGIERLVTCVV